MTDTKKLRDRIRLSGYKLRFIADRIGLSYQGLLNKIENHTEFKATEIQALCLLLGVTDEERTEIFFAESVGK